MMRLRRTTAHPHLTPVPINKCGVISTNGRNLSACFVKLGDTSIRSYFLLMTDVIAPLSAGWDFCSSKFDTMHSADPSSVSVQSFNQAVPRYTSYPTVPAWDVAKFDLSTAHKRLVAAVEREGHLFLYIHLPFCESLCTYCGCTKRITKNHRTEEPYIAAVLEEWQRYRAMLPADFKISGIHLGGGTPTFFSPENLRTLIEGLLQQAHLPAGEWYSFEGHPGNTTAAHLQTLFDLGFRRVSFGIQDFDAVVQKAINRMQTFEEVHQVTALARQIGYTSVNYDLIYGLPFQTAARMQETLAQTIQLQPDRIAFYSYAHVPWVSKSQRAYDENDLPLPDEKFALYQMGCKAFQEAGYCDVGMDHFVKGTDSLFQARKEGQLHRNFMGYTHAREKLLLGLGVSAISDVGDAYWQNVKTVEGYQDQLLAGHFPAFKGHLHTDDDLLRKHHILQLACYFKTNWHPKEWEQMLANGILDRLEARQAEGLLKLATCGATLTAQGKDLLRLCCAAFDAYLPQQSEGVFSKAI